MSRFYFEEIDSERCCDRKTIYDRMRFDDLKEREVYEAEVCKEPGFFYCKHFGEVGEVGESCGKICSAYSPRNGKSGRCRYSGHTYTHGKKVTIRLPKGDTSE